MLVKHLSLSSPISAEHVGLTLLISTCVELSNAGSLSVDALWPGEHDDLQSLLKDRGLFSSSRSQLTKLKAASRLMAELQFALSTKIEMLERTIIPASQHFGFKDLPDEVLMLILRHSNKDMFTDESEILRRTALVNRRFRNIVYSMPVLWSDICTGYHTKKQWWQKKKVDRWLRRFPCLPLNIDLYREGDRAALKLVSSWRKLAIAESSIFARDPPAMELHSVEEISTFSKIRKDGCLPILQVCELPRLRKLRCSYTIGVPIAIMSKLTSLILDSLEFHEHAQIVDFCNLLGTGTELRILEIHGSFLNKQGFPELPWPPARAQLPNIETFVYTIINDRFAIEPQAGTGTLRAIASIPHAFDMPNVVYLELETNGSYGRRELCLDDMFPNSDGAPLAYPSLRHLCFEARTQNRKEREAINGAFVPRLLRHFPHVDHFELRQASFNLGTAAGKVTQKAAIKEFDQLAFSFARLRELHLRCTDMSAEDLEKLLVAMFQQNKIELERIGIDFEISRKRHICAPMDPGYWTQFIRQRLKREFCVEFCGGMLLDYCTYTV